MKLKIQKVRAQLADLSAKQKLCLDRADAADATPEAKAAAIAEFDAIADERAGAKAMLGRLEAVAADDEAATAQAAAAAGMAERRPAGESGVVPAAERRHGPLKAFRGAAATQDAYYAGRWAAATIYGHQASAKWLSDSQGLDLGATLTTRDNGGAAYFVPTVVETAVIELMLEYGMFRQMAEIVPMSSLSSTTPRWTGTMIPYFVAEGQKPAQSDPAWDQVEVVAKDLAAMTKISRDLAEDSFVNLGDKIAVCIAQAFSLMEDRCGFFGDGTSQFGGIVGLVTKLLQPANAASLVTTPGHPTVQQLTLADYYAVVGSYPNYANADPVWICSKYVWANSMLRLSLAAGGTQPADIMNGGKPMFLGYPVQLTEVMPAAAANAAGTVPVLFADLDLSSKLGDRRGRTVEQGFENDDFTRQLRTVLATQRFGITNHTVVDPRNAALPGPVMGLQLTA